MEKNNDLKNYFFFQFSAEILIRNKIVKKMTFPKNFENSLTFANITLEAWILFIVLNSIKVIHFFCKILNSLDNLANFYHTNGLSSFF